MLQASHLLRADQRQLEPKKHTPMSDRCLSMIGGPRRVSNVLDKRALNFDYILELIDALPHLKVLDMVVNPALGFSLTEEDFGT